MDDSVTKIKKEIDDLPEDEPDLIDGEELNGLARDNLEPNFLKVLIKTEFKEETVDDGFTVETNQLGTDKEIENLQESICDGEDEKKTKIPWEKTEVKCEHCGMMCRKKSYKLHLMNHTGERPFKCDQCDKSYRNSTDLTYHKISHTGNHEHYCGVCGKGFAVKSALRAHMRTHTREKPFVCPICGKSFSHSSALKPHIAIHGNQSDFECEQCDRRYKTRKSLERHMRSHDLGQGMQCTMCPKFYKSKEGLRAHLKSHLGAADEASDQSLQTFACEQCGNTYKHLTSLKKHMRHHTKDMFKCNFCDKSYVDKDRLRIHLRSHTGETPYTCEICNKTFRAKDSFVYHKTTHETNRKTYKCDLCDKVLACKSSLRTHQTFVHSTEKNHHCHLCNQKFKMRFELTRHLGTHRKHGQVSTKPEEVVQVEYPAPNKTVCEICHADCVVQDFDEHMMSSDVKPLKCECKRDVKEEYEASGDVLRSVEVSTTENNVCVKKEVSEIDDVAEFVKKESEY